MLAEHFFNPNEKILFLIFEIGNTRFYKIKEIAKIMNCCTRTALRYLQRLKDLEPFMPKLKLEKKGGDSWNDSQFKIGYKL